MIQSLGSVGKTFHYGAAAMMEVSSDYYAMAKGGSERARSGCPYLQGLRKRPIQTDSYRGITLSPVFSKVLEFNRLEIVFMEANVPHVNQSGYRKKVSCADAVLATQEVIARWKQQGIHVSIYMTYRKPFTQLNTLYF